MGQIIAFVNQKGGVGKTTTAVNLTAALHNKGKKVLLCDFDPQANATSGLGVEKSEMPLSSYDLVINDRSAEEIIVKTKFGDLIPSSANLSGAGVELIANPNREYALQGYEVSAARYLSKPLDRDKVREALLHCCRLWLEQKAVLILTEHGYQKIPYTEIRYVEAFSRGTKFYLAGSTVESKMKFKDVEDALVKYRFAVCHRSYIVNLSQVRYIRRYEFELKDGGSVPIGKTRYGEIREQFLKYVED